MYFDTHITTEMLQRLNNKQVRGEGFTVSVLDTHRVQYVEAGRAALIEIDS